MSINGCSVLVASVFRTTAKSILAKDERPIVQMLIIGFVVTFYYKDKQFDKAKFIADCGFDPDSLINDNELVPIKEEKVEINPSALVVGDRSLNGM